MDELTQLLDERWPIYEADNGLVRANKQKFRKIFSDGYNARIAEGALFPNEIPENAKDEQIQERLLKAYRSTYGAKINPEIVSELMAALKAVIPLVIITGANDPDLAVVQWAKEIIKKANP